MNNTTNFIVSDVTDKRWEFEHFEALRDFLHDEIRFWKNQDDLMVDKDESDKHHYILSHNVLEECISEINKVYEQSSRGMVVTSVAPDGNTFYGKHAIDDSSTDKINRLLCLKLVLQDKWLWKGHDFTSIFIGYNKDDGINKATNYVQSKIVLCKYNQEFESIKEWFVNWGKDTKDKWDTLLNKLSTDLSDQKRNQGDDFRAFIEKSRAEQESLKKTYEEKLRLETSITYWDEAIDNYKNQGKWWTGLLILSLVAGAAGFLIILNTWLKGHAIGIQLDTIQGIILFGAGLTAYAFLVRTLSRLTFSSFHLMRDAQERKLLTYIYLSLTKDNKIDESSRDIVLQALFSRTETGLLAGDSSPTMPSLSDIAVQSTQKQQAN